MRVERIHEIEGIQGLDPFNLDPLWAHCVPPHSYEVRGDFVFVSSFGEYKIPAQPRRYYHSSLERWVRKAALLAKVHGLPEVARKIRQDFDEELTVALNGRAAPTMRGTI